jgi:hypothetical protein
MGEHQKEAVRLIAELLACARNGCTNGQVENLAKRAEHWLLNAEMPT